MQISIFTVSAEHPEAGLQELNTFLRGNKILTVSESFHAVGGYWTYSVRYLQPGTSMGKTNATNRKDYKELLGKEAFAWYSELRRRRKVLSDQLAVPAYVIFTNDELAAIARLGRDISPKDLAKVEGIGKGKVEKYGDAILIMKDEDGR